MRRAARKDNNHDAIREAFRGLGYAWRDTFQLGDGFGDGVTSGKWLGVRNVIVEIKDKDGKLTPAEAKFHREWPGEIITVYSVEQVILLDAIWAKGAKKRCPDST